MKVREFFSFGRAKWSGLFFVLLLVLIGSFLFVNKSYAVSSVTLTGSTFSDPDAEDTHQASQWVVTDAPGGGTVIYDSGTDVVNLTSITIAGSYFALGTTYYWKVRYEDNHNVWSDYSDESSFVYGGAPTATPTDTPTAAPTDTVTTTSTSTVAPGSDTTATGVPGGTRGIVLKASPEGALLKPGQTQQYIAHVFDQDGNDITSECPVTWSMQTSSAGSINEKGLLTATSSLGVWTDAVKATANCYGLSDFQLLTFATSNEARRLEYVVLDPGNTAVYDPIKVSPWLVTGYDQFGFSLGNLPSYSMTLLDDRIGTIPANLRSASIALSNNYGCYPNKVKGTATYNGVEKSAFGSISIYPADPTHIVINPADQVMTFASYSAPKYARPGQTIHYYTTVTDQMHHGLTGGKADSQYILHNSAAGQLAANGTFIATTNIGSYPGAVESRVSYKGVVFSKTFDIIVTTEQRKVAAWPSSLGTIKMWPGSNYTYAKQAVDQFGDPIANIVGNFTPGYSFEDVSGQNLINVLSSRAISANNQTGIFQKAVKVTFNVDEFNKIVSNDQDKILGPSPVGYLNLDINQANDNPRSCLSNNKTPTTPATFSKCLYDFVSPQKGDKWASGSLQQITWVSKDLTALANTKINVFLLTNNGQLETSVAMMQNDDGILPYQGNPRNSASSGKFQLDTYDSNGKQISSCTSSQVNFSYPSGHNPSSTANMILALGSLLAMMLSYLLALVAAIPSLSRMLSNIILAMFAPPVWPKQKSKWGIVYDALTKKSIQGAIVRIFSEPDGKLRDSRKTNESGEFGFVVSVGSYSVTASKSGYSFPTHIVLGSSDNQYHNIYKGGEIDVHPTEGGRAPLNINIPLDQTKANILDITVLSVLHFISKVVSVIRIPSLVVGTVFSVYLTITQGRWFDYLILIFYVALWAYEIADLMKKRTYGVVSDDSSQPIALAMVRVIDKANKLRATVVTGDDGKFIIALSQGEYRFEATRSGFASSKSEYIQINKMSDVGKVNLHLKKLVNQELYPGQDHSKL